jgi:16S rRNA (cytosine967-C5)-methyltransferase
MLVARALAPRPGQRVLDLCAAPGGKATHLAALMEGRGEVLAVERNRRRAGELARTAQRLRAGTVRVEVGDAARAQPGDPAFDRVLVDPPCSGLGTLQARADLRWRVTPAAVEQMAGAQAAILAAGAAALRPGGVLVYSTCTISPTENEHVITTFLDAHADFSLDDLASAVPALAPGRSGLDRSQRSSAAGAGDELPEARDMAGAVLTLPHRDHTAGFFIARLRRS